MGRDLKYNRIIRNENFSLIDLMLMLPPFEDTKTNSPLHCWIIDTTASTTAAATFCITYEMGGKRLFICCDVASSPSVVK